MKRLLLLVFVTILYQANCQLLSGDIVDYGRPLLTETNFTLKGTKEGVVVYEIAVDLNGNVTSESLVSSMTTITSTPIQMDAKNYIKKLKFKSGTGYPKFQHAKVKITFVLQ